MKPIPTKILLAALALTCSASLGIYAVSARADVPTPAINPQSWELSMKYAAPDRLTVVDPVKGPQTVWVFRYTVTNNTGEDILFTPSFQLITDTGQVFTAPINITPAVFKQIKDHYRNPFLESPVQVVGRLLQGEDNAKDGVAIFPAIDADARHIRILVSGLSGETATVTNPATGKLEYLRKTLQVGYDLPGQAIGIPPEPQFKGQTYVMK